MRPIDYLAQMIRIESDIPSDKESHFLNTDDDIFAIEKLLDFIVKYGPIEVCCMLIQLLSQEKKTYYCSNSDHFDFVCDVYDRIDKRSFFHNGYNEYFQTSTNEPIIVDDYQWRKRHRPYGLKRITIGEKDRKVIKYFIVKLGRLKPQLSIQNVHFDNQSMVNFSNGMYQLANEPLFYHSNVKIDISGLDNAKNYIQNRVLSEKSNLPPSSIERSCLLDS